MTSNLAPHMLLKCKMQICFVHMPRWPALFNEHIALLHGDKMRVLTVWGLD